MVLLTTTPTILAALDHSHNRQQLDDHNPSSSQPPSSISHKTLVALSKSTPYPLSSLLRGTKPYHPPPPPKPTQSPAYHSLMASLHAAEQRKQYNSLLSQQSASLQSLSGQPLPNPNDLNSTGDEQVQDDLSPQVVVNILLSVVMCAGAVFYMTRWWPNDGVRVLLSLGVAVVVGVAEAVVFAGYLRKVDEARRKERGRREVKTVMLDDGHGRLNGEIRDPDVGDGDKVETETIEIWGKGKHGGMRRRVREQWERHQESEHAEKD